MPDALNQYLRVEQVVVEPADGVLMEQTPDGVILRAAKLLGDDGKATSMAGEVWVPRENVAFAQLDE